MKFELWHAFVLGAILSWGVYVPVLHEGQTSMGGKRETRAVRAFLCVGLAYCITAVLVPLGLILSGIVDRDFSFTGRGFTFATLGGVAGAAGALCIILSIRFRGDPLYIAPLVFAGAPLVNAVVSMLWHSKGVPDWKFFAGIVLAAVGAGLVLYSKGELDKRPAAAVIQAPDVETAPSEAASHN